MRRGGSGFTHIAGEGLVLHQILDIRETPGRLEYGRVLFILLPISYVGSRRIWPHRSRCRIEQISLQESCQRLKGKNESEVTKTRTHDRILTAMKMPNWVVCLEIFLLLTRLG